MFMNMNGYRDGPLRATIWSIRNCAGEEAEGSNEVLDGSEKFSNHYWIVTGDYGRAA